MEKTITQKILTPSSLDKSYQDTMRRLSVSVSAESDYVFMPQVIEPYSNNKRSNGALFFVVLAHLAIVLFLAHKQFIAPAKLAPVKPMLVSLIAPPAPEPVLVPIIEPPKPVVQPKPKLKKVVEQIKPIEEPTERLVEATTEEVKEETPPAPVQSVQEDMEAKAPPKAEPVVEEKIEPPKFGVAYLHNPEPAYPRLSKRMGEEGRVLLHVLVDESGAASEVSIKKSSGSERLDQAALEAVQKWRFIPARKNNIALSAYVDVPIKFSLSN